MTDTTPIFIAHRGYPALYPENSLAGIDAATRAGARHVEIDIQLSNNLTPFLCHDDDLQRLTGQTHALTMLDNAEIEKLAVPYPASPQTTSSKSEPIARLSEFRQFLVTHPQVLAFIEIKAESIARFGLQTTVAAIFDEIYPVRAQCIMISFDWKALALIRTMGMAQTGWVVEQRDEASFAVATQLQPNYLFCGTRILPATIGEMWSGPWQWIIYSVNDPVKAVCYADAGFTLIETDDIGTMLGKISARP
ncbi:MAG: glycerophosphodiester phosphodiesterase family protein [Nitrosomonas sp.]|nr:glycerophosphodiester phosphodiesterase family protein [Nitrosomonas sp.]